MGNSLRVKYAAGVKLSLLFGLLLWLVMAVGAGCGSSQEGDFDAGLPRNPAAVAPSLAQLGAESLRDDFFMGCERDGAAQAGLSTFSRSPGRFRIFCVF